MSDIDASAEAIAQAERDVYAVAVRLVGEREFTRLYGLAIASAARDLMLNPDASRAYGGICTELFHKVMQELADRPMLLGVNKLGETRSTASHALTEAYRRYVAAYTNAPAYSFRLDRLARKIARTK